MDAFLETAVASKAFSNDSTYYGKHELLKLAEEWGWSNPADDILVIAEKSLFAQRTKSGEILVRWGIVEAGKRDELLKKKPETIPTLEYFSQQEPERVLPHVESILALKNGLPFYDSLAFLTPHPSMTDASVIKRCDELDAVLMIVEDSRPVLVFSSWERLIKYSTLGRDAKLLDPLIAASGGVIPKYSVGARDDISAVLKNFHGADTDAGEESATIWNGANAESDEARVIARLFDHALAEKAHDIALIPLRNGAVKVRIRKWGKLIAPTKVQSLWNAPLASKAINLLMTKSGANPYSTRVRVPTDGQITWRSKTTDAFMRLSFIPLNHLGEIKDLRSVSIRLFSRSESAQSLEGLNVPKDVAQQIKDAVQMPQGVILSCGPVNSGKSSTIAGAIGELVMMYGDSEKILTVEDPVERHLPELIQINAPTNIKDPKERFLVILRALKRHDLNKLWVGEVRDKDSAEFCTAFAGSGHLVFSTLHAKDTILGYDILSQMVDPGVRFQLAESMALVFSQRLASTLCPYCSEGTDHPPTPDEIRLFELNLKMLGEDGNLPETIKSARPGNTDCEKCLGAGYAGYMPIFEILPFTREVKDAAIGLLSGENMREQRNIIANARTVTLLRSGLELLRRGVVDLKSILFF